MKQKNLFIILGVIIVLALGAVFFYYSAGQNDFPKAPEEGDQEEQVYTQAESRDIAEKWVEENSPTYTYDGENLEFQEARALDLVGCENCYEFDFSFQSRQAGFGNREGQMSAQVITPHQITVWVENGEVTKAVTDGEFDEIKGELIE